MNRIVEIMARGIDENSIVNVEFALTNPQECAQAAFDALKAEGPNAAMVEAGAKVLRGEGYSDCYRVAREVWSAMIASAEGEGK